MPPHNKKEWTKIINEETFIEKEVFGFKWKLSNLHMSCIDRYIINGAKWEGNTTAIVKKLVKRCQTIIDIGANIGYFTLIFSRLVGNKGKVIAFEPFPYFYDRLIYNLKLNPNIDNVITVNKGLYNKNCKKLIARGFPSAAVVENENENLETDFSKYNYSDFIVLDEWCEENNIKNVDVIKIDTDGSEVKIIKGAIKTIEKYKPVILCEFYHDADILGKLFWDIGYKIYTEETDEEVDIKILEIVTKSKTTRNFICR